MCAIGFFSVGSTITGVFVVVSADVVVSVVVAIVVAADVVDSAFVVVVSFDESGVVVVSLFPPPHPMTDAQIDATAGAAYNRKCQHNGDKDKCYDFFHISSILCTCRLLLFIHINGIIVDFEFVYQTDKLTVATVVTYRERTIL